MCVCLVFVYRSVCLSVVCLAVGPYVCLSLGHSVCGQSVYVPVCVPSASVCLHLSVSGCLSVYLSIYHDLSIHAVGRSQLSAGQSQCARSVQAAEGEDAESESGRLRTQERKTGLMNAELRSKDGG